MVDVTDVDSLAFRPVFRRHLEIHVKKQMVVLREMPHGARAKPEHLLAAAADVLEDLLGVALALAGPA